MTAATPGTAFLRANWNRGTRQAFPSLIPYSVRGWPVRRWRTRLGFTPRSFAACSTLRLDWRSRAYSSVGVTDRVGSLSLVRGAVMLTGNLGVRRAPDERTTFGGVSALVALSRVVALQLGAESYPSDRLTGALGGHAISAGFVLRTPSGPRPLPRPNDVAPPARGLTQLAIRAPDARTVEVAGDWSDWRPVPAARAPNGVWYADLAIPAGEHRYAFRIDGKEWRVPRGAIASDDGVGGKSAWLTVSRAAN